MAQANEEYLKRRFPGADRTGALLSIPGLDAEDETMKLVVEAYSKMCRKEVPIPPMISDDIHLQDMLFSYGRGLELGGYSEGELPWMARTVPGVYSDETLMNAGIASLHFNNDVNVMKSNGVALVMSYSSRMSENTLSGFTARHKAVKMMKDMCGSECKKLFLPMCKHEHWGYFIIQGLSTDAICDGATVSWGDSLAVDPTTHQNMLNAIIHILKQCFPRASFSSQGNNHYRETMQWECQRDGWSCGLYVLAVLRKHGQSDFIPQHDVVTYNVNQLMDIRRACEKAMWYAVLVHLYIFGKDTQPDVIMFHLYNGLCISKDINRFVNEAIAVRQAVLEEDDRQREEDADKEAQEISSSHETDENGPTPQESKPNGRDSNSDDVISEGRASSCSGEESNTGHKPKSPPPRLTEAQRGVRERRVQSLKLPPGPIYDDFGNLIFDKNCNPVVMDMYEDKKAPRFMDFPEVLSEEAVRKMLGTVDDGNEGDDGICDTLLRDGEDLSVEQRVKYVQHPAPYLDGLALGGEYYGNLKHDVVRMPRGLFFLRYNCVMFRRESSEKCLAELHVSRRAKEKSYKVERVGFHNHGPVAPSRRHKQTIKKLSSLCGEYEGSLQVVREEKDCRVSDAAVLHTTAPSENNEHINGGKNISSRSCMMYRKGTSGISIEQPTTQFPRSSHERHKPNTNAEMDEEENVGLEPDADDNNLTARSIEVLRASLSRYHHRLRRGELRAHILSLLEEYGYQCSVRRSDYYDPAPAKGGDEDSATGVIRRAYLKRSTVQCMHKDGYGRCPFRLGIRGYFSKRTAGMEVVELGARHAETEELGQDPRFTDKVYSAIVYVKCGKHSHKRDEHLLKRFLPLHMTEEAIYMRQNGRIPFSDIVAYLEHKHATYVSGTALRRRIDWQIGKQCPRDQEAQVLIERLHGLAKSEYGTTFD